MKSTIVTVPSIASPITRSHGFTKKELATWKLDIMGRCGFHCTYCSSTTGNYQRINRGAFADAALVQLGHRVAPVEMRDPDAGHVTANADPGLVFAWPDVLERLSAQLATKRPSWGAGETLVYSQLTDAFSDPPLRDGTTESALRMVLERTAFRVRILTKNSTVGLTERWRELFVRYKDRVIVGLSTGTLDDAWAKVVEAGTPPPSARVRATRALQGAGVPTFGMLCPVFPDVLAGDGVEKLVEAIDPSECETVWAEPFNDRANWRAVRAGYAVGSFGYKWFTDVYEGGGGKTMWSAYATDLFLRLRDRARRDGWSSKLRYLLYEGDITQADAKRFVSLDGVLLQNKPVVDAQKRERSPHPVFAGMQDEDAAKGIGS